MGVRRGERDPRAPGASSRPLWIADPVREYTSGEFVDVATRILTSREGTPEEFAADIAKACLALATRDVRQAIRIARLARTPEDIQATVETMRRRR